jgi:hypothetical protein
MGIYLGTAGAIRLRRMFGYKVTETITTEKVNTSTNTLDLSSPETAFVTGDKVTLNRDSGNLDFIVGASGTETYYVHVNTLQGLRFFTSWADALTNADADAQTLQAPTGTYDITLEKIDQSEQALGQISSFEVSTSRDTEQVASLSESFTRNVSTLISGSGSITCFWNYDSSVSLEEQANFFHNLILSQDVQSEFTAALIIKSSDAAAVDGEHVSDDREFFYLVNALVTNVALSFEAADVVRSRIDFVTTGEIKLLFGNVFNLLQENASKIELEQGGALQGGYA